MNPKPKRLPRPEREQQMLDAAIAVFSRGGFHQASMDDIAERAGISKPMLYMYLGSKDELFRACIRREANVLIDVILEAAAPDLSPEMQIWRGFNAFFTFVASRRDGWSVLYRQARGQGGPFADEVVAMEHMIVDRVARLLAGPGNVQDDHGVVPPEMLAYSSALIGAAEALTDWLLDHPGETPEATSTRLMNVAWSGLRNAVAGRVWTPDALPAADAPAVADALAAPLT